MLVKSTALWGMGDNMRRALTTRFLLCLALAAAPCLCADSVLVRGVVRDATGAVVVGATVTVNSGDFSASARTDQEGKFSFTGVPGREGTLQVTAAGFADAHKAWSAGASPQVDLEIVLRPSSVSQQVVVSAARTEIRLADSPGSTVLLAQQDVAASPSLMVDDILRQVPGFTLFRRSDSRSANPGSQGVSLRGLGPSGASRALVLEDGIPMVDPFGGWVFWDRIPSVAVSSMEVFRGGGSHLYGSDALGGVVQFISRQPKAATPAFTVEGDYGNERSPDLSFWTGTRVGKWDLEVSSSLFRTDGYIPVPLVDPDTNKPLRGTIDAPVDSEHAAVDIDVGRQVGAKGRAFVRGNYYTESRDNGTVIQKNDTRIGQGSAGLDQQFGTNDSLAVRLFGNVETYHQSYSAIAPNRDHESLTDLQTVPSQQLGASGQWTHLFGRSDTVIAGGDVNEVIGASDDQLFSKGPNTANNAAGGRQRTAGVFGEDILRLQDKWTIILGARFDDWRNFDASWIHTPVSTPGPIKGMFYPDRSENAFSPRLSVLRALNQHVAVTGSIYRAFRAPTLNELYRNFQVGNVFTLGNAALAAEHLTGAEAGGKITGWNGKLDLRGTFFWSDIVDPVENVTVNPKSSPILAEKENLGRTRSRGLELDGVVHLDHHVQISAGYAYTDATVVQFTSKVGPSLVGLDVPQVPRQQFTWEARYWNPSRLLLSLQGRFVGQQFDDSLNQYLLARFYAMDLLIGRNVNRHVEVFAAAENVTDKRYQVARTPTLSVGPPILFRVGMRVEFPGRR